MLQICDNVHTSTLDEHDLTLMFLEINVASVGFACKYMASSHSVQILRQAKWLNANFQPMIIHGANHTFRHWLSIYSLTDFAVPLS